jgi:putative membrane protein
MSLSKEDHDRIAIAIRSAEANTSSEVVCVLARTSSHLTALPIFVAAVVALAVPWVLMFLTVMTVQRILSLQVIIFIGLLMLLSMPKIRVALTPRNVRRAVAHRLALDQFVSRGLGHNRQRRGVLIFVSLAERYARIIVGDEVAALIPQSHWQLAVDALTAHMRNGRIADGFVAAIDLCVSELAKHFPRAEGGRNNPERIYVI